MTQSTTTTAAVQPIYTIADIVDTRVYDVPEGATVETTECGKMYVCGYERTQYRYLFGFGITQRRTDPVSVAAKLREMLPRISGTFAPTLSAEELAHRIIRRQPMTPGALIADPTFARLARAAAEADKKYTQELLAWDKKETVMIAVSHFAEIVAAERSAESRRQAKVEAERKAKADREAPTVAAVTAAYRHCKYRTCKQGHTLRVEVVTDPARAGVSSDTVRGDRYSSRCTFAKTESVHTIRVPADWLDTVSALDLGCYYRDDDGESNGMLVLRADIVGHTTTEIVYELLTVRQRRGTSLETETVRIAIKTLRPTSAADFARDVKANEQFTRYTDPRVARDACIDAGLIAY